ncbi:MAG: efflux transporter outer membrane subunit [Gemmataceae bacterium]|nr:efflux transporter outer membrane subunit [Gemmataceae bacterium]
MLGHFMAGNLIGHQCKSKNLEPTKKGCSGKQILRYWAFGSLLLGVTLGSGCTHPSQYWRQKMKVGPDYLRPDAKTSEDWIDTKNPRVKASISPDLRWWEQFNDPTLNGLIETAYRENFQLKDSGYRVLAARANYNIKVGQFLPQSQTLLTGYDRVKYSSNLDFTQRLPENNFSLWSTGFNLTWELDAWGKLRRNIESSQGSYQASVEEYDGILVSVVADLANYYVDYRVAQTQVESLRKFVVLMQGSLDIAEDRFKGGATTEVDVEQAKLNLAQTQAQIPPNEKRVRHAANAMCVLLGISTEDLTAKLGKKPIPPAPVEAKTGIPADLLRRRPDVRQAERNLAAQCAQIGVAEAELYPSFVINGYLGLYSSDISQLFSPGSMFGKIGPVADWKILNYGRLVNNIRMQDAKFQSLGAAYQQTVLNAGRETENGLIEYIKMDEAAKFQAKAVQAAVKSVDLAKLQYFEGTVDFNRVYLLERQLVQEQIKLNDNLGSVSMGIINTYRSLGGGWEMRLEEPALSEMETRPSPRTEGVTPNAYETKPRPAGFGYWRELLKNKKVP